MKKVYLDNGATTRVDDQVAEAMQPLLTKTYGNPSSIHGFGREVKQILNKAREKLAKSINAGTCEIIFTSGGTEANNIALKTVGKMLKDKGKSHIITSKIEHPSILNTCKSLEKQGFEVTYLNVDSEGVIDLTQLKNEIKKNTGLITIMHANNEIGAIQPLEEIGNICKKHNILFHTDAVQSFTKTPLDVQKFNLDLASFSAHKLHGPKGIGALYIKKDINLEPYFHGGHQEYNKRAGTENIPAIVGFAKAVEITQDNNNTRMQELRDYTIKRVLEEINHTRLNGSKENRLPNNINISFDYIEGESLLMKLDEKGIAVSTSSACASLKAEGPSYVLIAIGLEPMQAHGAIRFTLSRYTTKEEIDYTINNLKIAVEDLRKLSPLSENVH